MKKTLDILCAWSTTLTIACTGSSQSPAAQLSQEVSTPIVTLPTSNLGFPSPPASLDQVNQKIEEGAKKAVEEGQKLFEKGKEVLVPGKPAASTELPEVVIESDPSHVAGVSTFSVPATLRCKFKLLNSGKTSPIKQYNWTIEKLGIPFFSKDETIATAEGESMSFTFSEPGRYRVTGTVTTTNEEKSSTSISILARA